MVERLTKRADFLAARRGRRANGPLFFVEIRDRGDAGPPRVGYTVTRKVGNAVERNRIRRRLREVVRLSAGERMRDGVDYVVVARRETLSAPFARLMDELTQRVARNYEMRPARAAHPDERRSS